MIDPKTVHSPKDRWTLLDVLGQFGGEKNNWWSLALGRWTDEEGYNTTCLATRWNGGHDPNSKGNPISRGYPTWFILPGEISDSIEHLIPESKRSWVKETLSGSKSNHSRSGVSSEHAAIRNPGDEGNRVYDPHEVKPRTYDPHE